MSQTVLHDRDSGRIDKMVRLRNVYLDYVRADASLRGFDLALLWDMDIIGTLYLDGLGLTGYYFAAGIDGAPVDAICANGAAEVGDRVEGGKYYDPYAHEDMVQSRTFTTVDDISPPICSREPMRVRSCFNGFMFYRLGSLLAGRYALEKVGSEAICEHVGINRGMTVYLNPGMLYLMEWKGDFSPWDVFE